MLLPPRCSGPRSPRSRSTTRGSRTATRGSGTATRAGPLGRLRESRGGTRVGSGPGAFVCGIHTYTYMCIYTYIYIYVCMYVYFFIYICMHAYRYRYVCIYVCVSDLIEKPRPRRGRRRAGEGSWRRGWEPRLRCDLAGGIWGPGGCQRTGPTSSKLPKTPDELISRGSLQMAMEIKAEGEGGGGLKPGGQRGDGVGAAAECPSFGGGGNGRGWGRTDRN